MRLREKRILRFLELKMSHGSGAQHKQPWDLKAILLEVIGQDFYNRAPREGASSIVRIKHGKVFTHANEEFIGLLLIHADARSIEASYADLQTGGARSIPMQDGEGVRTEAHVVIRLSHTKFGMTQCYPVALEESPGLSPSVLLSRLQRPVHKAGQRSKKNSAGETLSWYPVIELDGLFSKSLLDEIESGSLNSFDLVRQSVESGGMDEPGELVRQQQVLRVGVRPGPEEGLVARSLAAIRKMAFDEDYEQIRIHYKEAGSSKSKTAVIDVDENAPDPAESLDQLVSRSAVVSLVTPMNWDHEEVVDDFLELMAERLLLELEEEA
ncbi:hypothetical protein D3C81_315790 [compost metagenome]|uniref:hypothetical protein n=1 Tax=Stenotrophomonas lactitubi TaxID=2045214 RepID=UPI000F982B77